MNPAQFVVTRQLYYYSGENVVEIAQGGRDYSGSDLLVIKYQHLGESKVFEGPIAAVNAAIQIAEAWKKDSGKDIKIALGNTLGMGLELESEDANEKTYVRLRELADQINNNLPCCKICNKLLSNDETPYCSERCYLEDRPDLDYFWYLEEDR